MLKYARIIPLLTKTNGLNAKCCIFKHHLLKVMSQVTKARWDSERRFPLLPKLYNNKSFYRCFVSWRILKRFIDCIYEDGLPRSEMLVPLGWNELATLYIYTTGQFWKEAKIMPLILRSFCTNGWERRASCVSLIQSCVSLLQIKTRAALILHQQRIGCGRVLPCHAPSSPLECP